MVKRAIGIGVASGAKDNVVAVGKAVDERLAEIEQLLPIGIELTSLYPEDKIADEANNGFILNLIESLVIVILIIFVVMGSRAGMLIGSSLLFSVGGTLLIMLMWGGRIEPYFLGGIYYRHGGCWWTMPLW